MSPSRLWAVSRKETIQLSRDPRSLALAFVLPMALLLFFGYAISFDVKDIKMAVLDQNRTQQSRSLVEAFERSGYFRVVSHIDRYGDTERLLGRGDARLALAIPPRFSQDLMAGRPAPVQLLLDGGDANTATIAKNYADAIVTRYSVAALAGTAAPTIPVETESRVWYNETLESRNMVVPGLIAVIMAVIAAMLTALTIAREWERGTMEQLAATPVHRLEVVLGKLLPYVAIGLVDVTLAALAGILVMGVPFHGNVLLLSGMTLLFLVGALGLGIFISAAVKTQVLATQVAMIATFLPALLLSGFIFSIATMPVVLKLFTYIVPARYFITVTRGIFLKGVGVQTLWIEGLAMIVFAIVGLTLATQVFKKEIA
ncbi:MAG: ABC transporter permease [Gemmatimonadota bacterium]|nr:MAG: ABC transporter permease [Gemmatimonadota bacterium]